MDSPFPARLNPAVDRARDHLAEWVERWSLVRTEGARRRFALADFGWFASVTYPTASPEHAELMADWFGWLFLVDDQLDDGSFGRDPAQAWQALSDLIGLLTTGPAAEPAPPAMPQPAAPQPAAPQPAAPQPATPQPATPQPAMPQPATPAAASLVDLWRRTSEGMTARWRERFVGHVADCFEAAARWEAGNRVRGTVPDEATYIRRRRDTGAIYVCMDLIDVVEHLDVPADTYHSGPFRAALDAACNVVCWTNDLYSFDKEHALGEFHNLVSVVAFHRGLSDEDACAHVADLIGRETDRYLHLEAVLRADRPGDAAVVEPYLAGMRSWMRGNLDWSRRTKRYRERYSDYLEPLMSTAVAG